LSPSIPLEEEVHDQRTMDQNGKCPSRKRWILGMSTEAHPCLISSCNTFINPFLMFSSPFLSFDHVNMSP